MGKDEFFSSDESNHSSPITRKRPARNAKPVLYEPEFTSDSDDEKIVFKKVKDEKLDEKNEKILGEISLLTSDDDYIPETPPVKRRVARKPVATSKPKKIKTIEICTSDEEENGPEVTKPKLTKPRVTKPRVTKPKAAPTGKKRKLSESNSTDTMGTCASKKAKPAPKPKSLPKSPTQKTKVITEATTVAPTRTAPSKPCFIESPNVSLDISIDDITPTWNESELLAEKTEIDEEVARNLIRLWEEGNTIPFIARYRKNVIGDMTPEDLRTAKEGYDEICVLKKKMITVVKSVIQLGKLHNKLQGNICSARSMEELEHIYAPFKPDNKGSLVERAKRRGLEEPALHLLNNTSMINLANYVNPNISDVKSVEDVEKGIIHILASEMTTDPEMLTLLRELRGKSRFRLLTKKARQVKTKEKSPKAAAKSNKKAHSKKDPAMEEKKFEMYFEFNQGVDFLKSHQILAINRGESLKILSVKIEIPTYFENKFKDFCARKWTDKSKYDIKRQEIINAAIEDAYQRLITPLITREIRADLKLKADKESCRVFSDNLKHLLLNPPMKGKPILGIDPGYTNGCKLALISPTGTVLAQNVVYPHNNRNEYRGERVIKDMLMQHRCNLIAIGNGTACRQTEEWISELIKSHYFGGIDVQYTIVSEDGASIYSCSPEARKEFGGLDPNIISAVSLARRIQDPMAELVKVEPCHLGIGMYQLDIKKKQLEEALSEVVSECVSFVGVDLNTASQCLLRRVAGLSEKRATQIIDHRERAGPFTHRRELLKVFGIGERIFEQCAGFLRVGPTDPNDVNFYKKPSTTPLDATIIHPESYPIVRNLLGKMDLKEKDIGTEYFIRNFKIRSKDFNIENLAKTSKTDNQTIQLIFDALGKTLNHDLRTEVSKTPLFKKGVTSIEDLELGSILTGRVKNVTSFGAFTDIGVQRDGLVHNKFMKGLILHLGDVIEVKVIGIDVAKGHIQLEAIRKIS